LVIFGAGTGSYFFDGQRAAAPRAMEMKADVILKGYARRRYLLCRSGKVADAKFFSQVTYRDVVAPGSESDGFDGISLAWIMAADRGVQHESVRNIKRVVMGERVGST